MGLVRKTLSVGTLGVVSFRSKKERLRRAERSWREAEEGLRQEHAARSAAEARISQAEKRMQEARSEAEHAVKKLEKARGRSRGRHRRYAERLTSMLAAAEPVVRTGIEEAATRGKDAGRKGRKHAAKAARRAERSLHTAKELATDKVEQLTNR
jgi:hypothetical protein